MSAPDRVSDRRRIEKGDLLNATREPSSRSAPTGADSGTSPVSTSRGPSQRRLKSYITADFGYGSTTQAATDALREAILDGVLPPGTWLRETDLAVELGVSRTPIREAITRLHNEGLVARTASSGAVVASLSLEDVLAVYAVREALEATAVRLVVAAGSAALVDSLRQIQRRMERAIDKPNAGQKLAQLNILFHAQIRDATDNAYLKRFLVEVEHAVRRFQRSGYGDRDHMLSSIAEHGLIIEAIAAGDAEVAAAAAAAHMRSARQMRIQDLVAGLSSASFGVLG